jgi:hypothetical protein
LLGDIFTSPAEIPVAEEGDQSDDRERREKKLPPGTMNLAGKSSNPIAAIKATPAKRERRLVRTAATAYVQLHSKANNAARGEVSEVLGQAAQNAASPTILAVRKTHVSRVVPMARLSIISSLRWHNDCDQRTRNDPW